MFTAKLDGICTSLDAMKCFDRLCPNLTTIAFARLGLPISTGICIGKTLNNMNHKMKIASSTSEVSISAPTGSLWSGYFQGSAAAGPACIANSTTMLNQFNHAVPSTIMTIPDSNIQAPNEVIGYCEFQLNTELNKLLGNNDNTVNKTPFKSIMSFILLHQNIFTRL